MRKFCRVNETRAMLGMNVFVGSHFNTIAVSYGVL